MKFFDLKSFYIITDIKEHLETKLLLLSQINKTNSKKIEVNNDFITKTDWNTVSEQKIYTKTFCDMINPYINIMCKKLYCDKWYIRDIWFQVYGKNSRHDWHLHTNTNYTNIYYLHLPNEKIKTEILDITTNKIIDNIEVKEGQMLTFPANVIHRSPTNIQDDAKVIIAFNSNFDEVKI